MVYLREYLDPSYVLFLDENDKNAALNRMIDCLNTSPHIIEKEAFRKAVFEREKIMSTGIGLGIAIPHVKMKGVEDFAICVGVSKKGIAWESIDNHPVHIVFLIAGAAEQHAHYLRILSKIILVLKKRERREKLIKAKKAAEILDLFENL